MKVNPMKICFSNESSFEVGYDGRNFYITQAPGEEYLERNLKPTMKSGRSTVSIWACFCGYERGPCVVLSSGVKMTAQEYLNDILIPHFIPFYRKMQRKYRTPNSPVYMQEDNNSIYTAKLCERHKKRIKIRQLAWPPNSPDLAPIENAWKKSKDIVGARRHKIRTKESMGIEVVKSWGEIKQSYFEKLARSFPNRLEKCIKARGSSIKY